MNEELITKLIEAQLELTKNVNLTLQLIQLNLKQQISESQCRASQAAMDLRITSALQYRRPE